MLVAFFTKLYLDMCWKVVLSPFYLPACVRSHVYNGSCRKNCYAQHAIRVIVSTQHGLFQVLTSILKVLLHLLSGPCLTFCHKLDFCLKVWKSGWLEARRKDWQRNGGKTGQICTHGGWRHKGVNNQDGENRGSQRTNYRQGKTCSKKNRKSGMG